MFDLWFYLIFFFYNFDLWVFGWLDSAFSHAKNSVLRVIAPLLETPDTATPSQIFPENNYTGF